ncbi:MAG: mannose-1-phosphate guanylyltransferase/mannose-6-phosphate isomerase [Gammaproteobacteria bacterium]|nr:mannose-1-phosphate guanylyltransferase/mannose-6-phosphate isomerase [Gammaproteobacteria bacterium]
MILQPVILSGGSGTRLWPLSREHFPKQLIALFGELSLLQNTVMRMDGLDSRLSKTQSDEVNVLNPLIICNEEHRFLVGEQVRQIKKNYSKIILEPVGRNTAPAMTLAALAAAGSETDPILLVMPADHLIKDVTAFHQAVVLAVPHARAGGVVTFGIVPDAPETGFGYIKKGARQGDGDTFTIAAFVEKPDLKTAEKYLNSGDYLWNSGIFMMTATTWMTAIKQYRSDIAQSCVQAFEQGAADRDFFRVDAKVFAACPSDSIDYAVMEKIVGSAKHGDAVVVPLDAGWSDVGSWASLWSASEHDAAGNVKKGDVHAIDSKNNVLIAEHRVLATVGLEDIIAVETADAVLVAHKDRSQDIKKIVEELKRNNKTQYQTHRRVSRPWGCYESIDNGERFQVKRITVNPRAALSLQMHHHRAEHWIVVKGTAKVTRGDEILLVSENQSTYIPVGMKHRLENPGTIPLELIEVQSGSYLGEDDIVRFEDVYGR